MDTTRDFYTPRHDGVQGELELALLAEPKTPRIVEPEEAAIHPRKETGLRYACEIGGKRIGYGIFEGRKL